MKKDLDHFKPLAKESFKSECCPAGNTAGKGFYTKRIPELLRSFRKRFIPGGFPANTYLCPGFIFLCLLFSSAAETTVQDILHAPTLQKLQTRLKKHRILAFQKTLCEKQLLIKAIPYACHPFPELRKAADSHCLELGIKNVTLSSPLSTSCRKYLKNFEKILLYRKKDTAVLKNPLTPWERKNRFNP